MSSVVAISETAPLVPYNQASVLLTTTTSSPAIPIRTIRNNVLYFQPRPSLAQLLPRLNSLNAALSAGLVMPNPNGKVSGVVAQSASALAINSYSQTDQKSLTPTDLYAPVSPTYVFPPSTLRAIYTSNLRQTTPSTASVDLRQTLSSQQSRTYA